jgi:lichenan operon transcriptional antiterminator
MYDVAVYIADLIGKEWDCVLSEDEISYIALHLGALFEEQRALQNKVRAILVCPQYYTCGGNLAEKISSLFDTDLYLIGVVSNSYELIQYKDYDLVLTTAPFVKAVEVPLVTLSYYFTSKDALAVSSAIETIKKQTMKTVLEQKLKYLFHEDLFFINTSSSSYIEEISYMADALIHAGYVDADYKDRLYDREKISSSAYSNIAIPHPLMMQARKSAIAVSIHPRPISWQNNQVNLVFMLAITNEDTTLFRNIFDYISSIISDSSYTNRLIETKNYSDFIKLLVSLS